MAKEALPWLATGVGDVVVCVAFVRACLQVCVMVSNGFVMAMRVCATSMWWMRPSACVESGRPIARARAARVHPIFLSGGCLSIARHTFGAHQQVSLTTNSFCTMLCGSVVTMGPNAKWVRNGSR